MLCELLKSTAVAGCPEEFFEALHDTGLPPHPGDYLYGLPRTGAGIRDDVSAATGPEYSSLLGLDGYREHLDRTFAWGTTPNGVFGAKLMWNQLSELEILAGQLDEYAGLPVAELLDALFDGPEYVWVTRRDKVRQAVSLWKALQTRSWRAGERGKRPAELHYRFEGIDHIVGVFERHDRHWQSFFAGHGLDPLTIVYEDVLEGDPDGAVQLVLDRLGIDVPDGWSADQPIARQADELSEEWVASYHRDRAQRGLDQDVTAPVAR